MSPMWQGDAPWGRGVSSPGAGVCPTRGGMSRTWKECTPRDGNEPHMVGASPRVWVMSPRGGRVLHGVGNGPHMAGVCSTWWGQAPCGRDDFHMAGVLQREGDELHGGAGVCPTRWGLSRTWQGCAPHGRDELYMAGVCSKG